MTAQDKHILMTTAPVPRLIASLAIPTIISMLVTSIYVMVDTYYVGKINTQATAAVGISFSVMAIVQAFGFFFGHGSGNFISRRLGAKDYDNAEKMASTGFFYAFTLYGLIACTKQPDAFSGECGICHDRHYHRSGVEYRLGSSFYFRVRYGDSRGGMEYTD